MQVEKLIVQSEATDFSTSDVMEWISYYTDAGTRYYTNDFKVRSVEINIGTDHSNVTINDDLIDGCNQASYWYRRGKFVYQRRKMHYDFSFLDRENEHVMKYLSTFLASGKHINKFEDNFLNKIEVLNEARQAGLKIPQTLITNKTAACRGFALHKTKLLTKAIYIPHFESHIGDGQMINGSLSTVILNSTDFLARLAKHNAETLDSFILLQDYVDKKYEIRTFYLDGICHSMAIFSQQNEKTKYDFRHYDHERPNRLTPYQLPAAIEKKIDRLMKHMALNCGSIDLILTPDNEYYFLEVNPIGQFQWLSRNCNYYLEKQVAQKLLRNTNPNDAHEY